MSGSAKQTSDSNRAVAWPSAVQYHPVDLRFDPEKNPSRAVQSEAAACDINNILAKYQRTGAIDHANRHAADYGFVPAIDFREALDITRRGQDMFEELPSSIRRRFNHDPAEFLAFVQDPANKQALADLGLVKTPAPTTVAAPPPSKARQRLLRSPQRDSHAGFGPLSRP